MRRRFRGSLWALLVGLLLAPVANAADDNTVHAFATEQVTVAATAVGLTQSNYDRVPPALYAFCRNETAAIRYRADGTDPTATVGIIVESGDTLTLPFGYLSPIRFIRTGGSSATLTCEYVR